MLAVRDVPGAELRALLPPGVLDPRNNDGLLFPRLIEVDFASATAPAPDELAARLASAARG